MMLRVLFSLGTFGLLATSALAQQPAVAKPVAGSTAGTAFVLADVHASPRMRSPFPSGGELQDDRFIMRQSSLVDLVSWAYGVKYEMVQGGPSWAEIKRFDVIAKADPRTTDADLKLMVQSLLADRFKLVMHKGEASMPAYVLTAPGGKSKMQPSKDGAVEDCKYDPTQTAGGAPLIAMACTGLDADDIAMFLGRLTTVISQPVINQTGLEGKWDFTLEWTDVRQRAKAGAEAVSIFDSIDKELGLKLELKTAPRPVWLVDSANADPTPNSPEVAKQLPPLPPAQFEVATVKPSAPGEKPDGRIANGQVSVTAISLRVLINYAWDLSPNDPHMLVNAPAWLDNDKFTIMAKATQQEAVPGKGPVQIDDQELRQMIQALLLERFNMKAHMEARPIDAYTLVADHPKMKEADPKSRTRCKEGPGPDGKDPRRANPMLTVLWTCQNMTMAELGEELAHYSTGYVYSPVLDNTGLKGGYDFTMTWSSASLTILKPPSPPNEAHSAQDGASDPNGAVTLNDAIDAQLGIKIIKTKRPVPVLVIDHIDETPVAN
jgi:uncharacterized protein (TIGR03435 family)